MTCSSGCPTPGSHESYGQCIRAKHLEFENPEAHKFNQGVRDSQESYAAARRAGIQPKTLWQKDIKEAWKLTDKLGRPYRADKD